MHDFVAMRSIRATFLMVGLFIGACGGDRDGASSEESAEASLPGVYTGVFPCDGCPGIPTTMWIRSDGRFFFQQRYPEVDDRAAMSAYNLGRWSWHANDDVVVLEGAGPTRTFSRLDRDRLVMQTASELEHRLRRDPAAPAFSANIRMSGLMHVRGTSAMFTECLTGFAVPVSKGGDFRRFQHQYRGVGARGEQVYVELDGRFSWLADGAPGSLTIERFATIRPDGSCR